MVLQRNFQATSQGIALLEACPHELFARVATILHPFTKGADLNLMGDLLTSRWVSTHHRFELFCKERFFKVSRITAIEDLPYVSSPWLPRSVSMFALTILHPSTSV